MTFKFDCVCNSKQMKYQIFTDLKINDLLPSSFNSTLQVESLWWQIIGKCWWIIIFSNFPFLITDTFSSNVSPRLKLELSNAWLPSEIWQISFKKIIINIYYFEICVSYHLFKTMLKSMSCRNNLYFPPNFRDSL